MGGALALYVRFIWSNNKFTGCGHRVLFFTKFRLDWHLTNRLAASSQWVASFCRGIKSPEYVVVFLFRRQLLNLYTYYIFLTCRTTWPTWRHQSSWATVDRTFWCRSASVPIYLFCIVWLKLYSYRPTDRANPEEVQPKWFIRILQNINFLTRFTVILKPYECQHGSTPQEHKDVLAFIRTHIPAVGCLFLPTQLTFFFQWSPPMNVRNCRRKGHCTHPFPF